MGQKLISNLRSIRAILEHLPLSVKFLLIPNSPEFHSWNVYLSICALPALISSIGFWFMPESPKFLMTTGENERALRIFQKVYAFNTGKHPETYPVSYFFD